MRRARGDDGQPAEGRIAELRTELQLVLVERVEVLARHRLERVVLGILRLDQQRAVAGHPLGGRPRERQRALAGAEVRRA